ncbi:MAG: FAD-dependent oxidoreductase [Candidatus Omnitrophica bacterium]|nr:FAD-dependent oxidoreductase [Candidatus Omnitrophota bacterium]
MNNVIVIGGGFAGLAAAKQFIRFPKEVRVTLIDKRKTSDFLPSLPDVIGRGINPESLRYSIEQFSKKNNCIFIQDEVIAIDIDKKTIATVRQVIGFDYLLIASGTETNFYGNALIQQNAFRLDSVADAQQLAAAAHDDVYDSYIVAGAGYTGIEVATNLAVLFKKLNKIRKVVLVERAPTMLGPLPEWMKTYVFDNLIRLGIDVLTNCTVEKIEGRSVVVSGGNVFSNALVVWVAGVKTPGYIQAINCEKNPQGRLKVDAYLRINESCFVAGDAAYVQHQGNFLRMAIQFALAQGACAAKNILRSINHKPLISYKPFDFGYIIPLANNRSCGTVLGINMKGRLPTLLHFFMCIFRSWDLKNKWGIIVSLVFHQRQKAGR